MPGKAKTKARATKRGVAAPSKQKAKTKAERGKAPAADLAALKKTAQEAKGALDGAQQKANALHEQAKAIEIAARRMYAEAVAPYREACRKADVECEFAGSRAANVTPTVHFSVEKVKNGVKVMLKGQPETEQIIPFAELKKSIGKAAVAYVEKFIGDRATVGNKQGSLGNRLRAVLTKK